MAGEGEGEGGRGCWGEGGRGKGEGVVGIPEKLVGGERGTVRGIKSFSWELEKGEWNKFTSALQATSLTCKPTQPLMESKHSPVALQKT